MRKFIRFTALHGKKLKLWRVNDMALKFLNVSPEKAVKIIRECISKGWKLKEELFVDYDSSNKRSQLVNLDKWSKVSREWINNTYKKLNEIYSSKVEPDNFINHRATYYNIGISQDCGDIVIQLEGKISNLNQLYLFIFQHSNIQINTKGDVIFQYGNDSRVEIKNE